MDSSLIGILIVVGLVVVAALVYVGMRDDRARDPLLFYASIFMKWLLIGVMALFGVHTVMWFPRSWRARRAGPEPGPPSAQEKDEKE